MASADAVSILQLFKNTFILFRMFYNAIEYRLFSLTSIYVTMILNIDYNTIKMKLILHLTLTQSALHA